MQDHSHHRLADTVATLTEPPAACLGHQGRILQLDGLRAIAMLSVFVFHAWGLPLMWIGVDIFFVLSGYLITGILLKRRDLPGYFSHFYGRRARRILVPYFLLLAFSSLLFGTAWLREWYWYIFPASNIPSALGRVPNVTLDPLWSLAVEEQFYLFWPLLVLLLPKRLLLAAAASAIAIAPLMRGLATSSFHKVSPIYHLTPFRMDLLAAGALIAIVLRRWPHMLRWAYASGISLSAGAAATLLGLSTLPWFRSSANNPFTNTVLYSLTMLISAGLLLWCLSGTGVLTAICSLRPLRYLGRISYSMYLVHVCFLVLAAQWLSNTWGRATLALLLTIGYASVSWYLLEKPLLEGRRRTV